MTYVFKCPRCENRSEEKYREAQPFCDEHDAVMRRDYRSENARMQVFISALGDGKAQKRVVTGE